MRHSGLSIETAPRSLSLRVLSSSSLRSLAERAELSHVTICYALSGVTMGPSQLAPLTPTSPSCVGSSSRTRLSRVTSLQCTEWGTGSSCKSLTTCERRFRLNRRAAPEIASNNFQEASMHTAKLARLAFAAVLFAPVATLAQTRTALPPGATAPAAPAVRRDDWQRVPEDRKSTR